MADLTLMTFIERSFVMTTAHWFVLLLIVGCACWLISEMMDSSVPTLFAGPLMILGGAAGQYAMTAFGYSLAHDKFVNACFGMIGGILVAALLFVLTMWSSTAIRARS